MADCRVEAIAAWTCSLGWNEASISTRPALVAEADYTAAQNIDTVRACRDTSCHRYLPSGAAPVRGTQSADGIALSRQPRRVPN